MVGFLFFSFLPFFSFLFSNSVVHSGALREWEMWAKVGAYCRVHYLILKVP